MVSFGSAERDIESFLEEHGYVGVRQVAAPMASKALITSDPTLLDKTSATRYRSMVGSLQYFATETQWHLAHAVTRLAQLNSAPTVGAEKQLQQMMAWLTANSSRRLSAPVLQTTTWDVYSDSDHAGDRALGVRSHTGVVIMCNGAPVQWRSNKQPVTSVSSACAEIYAFAEAVRDARLTKWKAEESGCQVPTPLGIQVGNSSVVVFQSNMNPQSKLKGMIDLRWQWVKELQDTDEIRAVKVHTDLNVADLLTKPHGRVKYNSLLQQVEQRGVQLLEESGQLRAAGVEAKDAGAVHCISFF